jgi:hypothetical protein
MTRQRATVRVLCGLILCGMMTGCSDNSSPTGPTGGPNGPSSPQVFDRTFTLALGQAAAVADGTLEVSFRRVVKDERCGAAALCVAGVTLQAVLEFDLTYRKDGGLIITTPIQLSTDTAKTSRVSGYLVSLEQLAPYPISSAQEIKPEDYRVTLRITSTQS